MQKNEDFKRIYGQWLCRYRKSFGGLCRKDNRTGKVLRKKHKKQWNCMVLGLQRKGFSVIMPNTNMIVSKGDIMWIMGSNNNVGRLASENDEYEE